MQICTIIRKSKMLWCYGDMVIRRYGVFAYEFFVYFQYQLKR